MSHLAMKDELKPCPFCGSAGVIRKSTPGEYNDVYYVPGCAEGCSLDSCHDDEEGAVDVWNTRVPDKEAAWEIWRKSYNISSPHPSYDPRETFERYWTEKHKEGDDGE